MLHHKVLGLEEEKEIDDPDSLLKNKEILLPDNSDTSGHESVKQDNHSSDNEELPVKDIIDEDLDREKQSPEVRPVWYIDLAYVIKTQFWYLYVFGIILDSAAVFYFVIKDAYHQNYFETVFMQVYVFQQGFMGIFYLKELFIEKLAHKYSYVSHLQGDNKEYYNIEGLTSEEITQLAMKAHEICDVGDNIYSRGFKVLQKKIQQDEKYSLETILQATQMVFVTFIIQFLLTSVMYIQFSSSYAWNINYPYTSAGIFSRLMFSLVLHVQTERYVRYGLNMMKYAVNHPHRLSAPIVAFIVGLCEFSVSILITLACMIHLSNQQTTVDMASSYIAYGAICYTPMFIQTGLDEGDVLKKPTSQLTYEIHRREIDGRTLADTFLRIIYKTCRIFYCSFWYYFAPVLILLLPILANSIAVTSPT